MDPEVASDIVALMGKELKVCRATIRGLEDELKAVRQAEREAHDVSACNERIRAAESAMALLNKNIADVCEENRRLRAQVQAMTKEERVTVVKKEEEQVHVDKLLSNGGSPEYSPVPENETDEYIEKMRDALVKYYHKYKSLKTANKELVNVIQATTELENGNGKLQDLVDGARKRQDELTESITRLEISLQEVIPKDFADIVAHMGSLPKKTTNPPHPQSLRPIAWARRDFDLKEFLRTDCEMPSVASDSLFACGRFFWCSDERHSGVILGPIHSYDFFKKRWSQQTFFETSYDQTFQLFFDDNSFVYYAGRYKALDLRQVHARGVDFPAKGLSSRALAEFTISHCSERDNNDRPRDMFTADVADLYLDGVLKVECLGLQLVAFDQEVYGRLSRRFDRVRDRKAHRSGSEPMPDLSSRHSKRQKLS